MAKNFMAMPRAFVDVNFSGEQGSFEWWRHGIGQGGVNGAPLPDHVEQGIAKLKPRLIRVFLQEYFNVYPDHGVFDWSRLDPFMESLQRTGASVMATVNLKPPALYPAVDETIWRPNDVEEWQNVIFQLVKRYSVEKRIVTHWEYANETDIGETGGCPFLIPAAEENYEFYKMLIKPVLKAFPAAKVGGPAAAGVRDTMFREFVGLCRENGTPLDFVSWHCYHSDPAVHRALIEYAAQCVSIFGEKKPELVFNEINMGFDFADDANHSYELISVEEHAMDPRRAAFTAANILSMMNTKVDWTHYFLLWDGCMHPEEFRRFFSEKGTREVMYKHWNETPHRFGLFSEGGAVRPQYFVFLMLSRMGEIALETACGDENLHAQAVKRPNGASLLIANYNKSGTQDTIARCRFANLTPGVKRLTVMRVDDACRWDPKTLELVPAESRIVDTLKEFEYQCLCPQDSVTLMTLDDAAN